MGVEVPELDSVLPMVGTFGLILIVFEGALELQLERGRAPRIGKAFLVALVPLATFATVLAWHFVRSEGAEPRVSVHPGGNPISASTNSGFRST